MAILKLKPCFKSYLWGGNRLKEEYHKQFDGNVLAESWELSCNVDGKTLIKEGEFEGKTLCEYIEWEGKKVLGRNCMRFKDFPILIKFIDAKDNLSIQVHPTDEYAKRKEGQNGKTEMWYVVDCEEEAYLYFGFSKKISKEEFQERIHQNTLPEILNKIRVKKGDIFFIEAGTLHAIGKGIIIAEIQENSNITYRVYDYGRTGADGKTRDLHIEKAIEVINYNAEFNRNSFSPHLAVCNYFSVDKIMLDGTFMKKLNGHIDDQSFLHLLVLEGNGLVTSNTEQITCEKGDSILLTANTGDFELSGTLEALITTIPSMENKTERIKN